MPKVLIPLPDVYESVTRRVMVNIVNYLSTTMGLPEKTEIYLPGNSNSIPMNDAMFGSCCATKLHYPGESKLVIRFQEEAEPEYTFTTHPRRNNHEPTLFVDPELDITLRPAYRYVSLTAEIEYTAPNVTQATRWLDTMRHRLSQQMNETYIDLEYHYALPKPLMYVLQQFYDTVQNGNWPMPDTFEEWVVKYLKLGTYPKVISTLIDTDMTLTVPEHQYEVLCWFDFTDTPPTPEWDSSETGAYSVNFNFKTMYHRPTHVYATYPIIAHQRPVPTDIRSMVPYSDYRDVTRKVSDEKKDWDEINLLESIPEFTWVRYPSTDDWITAADDPKILKIYTGLLSLKPDDLRTIASMDNLGSVKFTPPFLEYIQMLPEDFLNPRSGVFEFKLYKNNELVLDNPLIMLPNSVRVATTKDLDPNYYYHIEIGLRKNWLSVDRDILIRLLRYPYVFVTLLKILGVQYNGTLLGDGYPRMPQTNYGEMSLICKGLEGPDWYNPGPEICSLVQDTGLIRMNDLETILKILDAKYGGYLSGATPSNQIPFTVLYSDILTFKK